MYLHYDAALHTCLHDLEESHTSVQCGAAHMYAAWEWEVSCSLYYVETDVNDLGSCLDGIGKCLRVDS